MVPQNFSFNIKSPGVFHGIVEFVIIEGFDYLLITLFGRVVDFSRFRYNIIKI